MVNKLLTVGEELKCTTLPEATAFAESEYINRCLAWRSCKLALKEFFHAKRSLYSKSERSDRKDDRVCQYSIKPEKKVTYFTGRFIGLSASDLFLRHAINYPKSSACLSPKGAYFVVLLL